MFPKWVSMLQLEDILSANVSLSGHISILSELKISCILLAHLVHYFLRCWLFCREQFEGNVLLIILIFILWIRVFSQLLSIIRVIDSVVSNYSSNSSRSLFVIGRNQGSCVDKTLGFCHSSTQTQPQSHCSFIYFTILVCPPYVNDIPTWCLIMLHF